MSGNRRGQKAIPLPITHARPQCDGSNFHYTVHSHSLPGAGSRQVSANTSRVSCLAARGRGGVAPCPDLGNGSENRAP